MTHFQKQWVGYLTLFLSSLFCISAASAPKHWAFLKPLRPQPPVPKTVGWGTHPIDAFTLSKMEQQSLAPERQADRHTLVRRLALDLTGLPPTPAEVEQFVSDERPDAWERLVDQYLASPAYGERWARIWLDLARYADSKGYGADSLRPYMWPYRDWVIQAFNRNLPYDQFTIHQLAGDLLPDATPDLLVATAFHRNTMANDEGGTDDEEFRVAAVKDRVDTTLQVWMGLTFGCAKCHSHKYDPISQHEYYSFYAFFNQTQDSDQPDDFPRHPMPTRDQSRRMEDIRRDMEPFLKRRDHPLLEFTETRREWEKRGANIETEWSPLIPERATAQGGTELYRQPDQTWVALGASPQTNVYQIECETLPGRVTALRLELFPVESSGFYHLSRKERSPLYLSDIKAFIQPLHPQLPKARYVRVELPGQDKVLSLAEVQVFQNEINLSLKGTATQSSTDREGSADRAIDGAINGHFEKRSVTHTVRSRDPWWEVDLGSEGRVDRVIVWNRTDSNLENRLQGFRVVLLGEDRSTRWSQSYSNAPTPSLKIEMNGSRSVLFGLATASQQEDGSGVMMALDKDATTGWQITHEPEQRHEAVFHLIRPLVLTRGEQLVLVMHQALGDAAAPAKFRWSATLEPFPLPAFPEAIAQTLRMSRSIRSQESDQRVGMFYWKTSTEYEAVLNEIKPMEERLAEIEKDIVHTPILRELPPDKQRLTRVLLKGNFLTPGESVDPGVPKAFHNWPAVAPINRLGVARWIMDPENPLTARVAVNRFWSALFSKGLVESEEDFGTQGTPPSHPELLDWLATEYIRLGWDTKALLKEMVTSATYKQSAETTAEKRSRDGQNTWLSRASRPRLEAEMIRDQALAVSGLLSRKLYGPSVYPYQPPNLWQAAFSGERTWSTSEGEDQYRRALYTFWRRTVPYPSLMSFDAPSREVCTFKRVPSNTPLQAFVTLNDPVFIEAAQALGRAIQTEGGAGVEERVRWAWKHVTSKPIDDHQARILTHLFQDALVGFQKDLTEARKMAGTPKPGAGLDPSPAETAAWTVVANILLNLDSFLTRS